MRGALRLLAQRRFPDFSVRYVSIQEASEHSHGGPRLISVPHNSGLH